MRGDPAKRYPSYDLASLESRESNRGMLQSRDLQNILLHRLTTIVNFLKWQSQIVSLLDWLLALTENELARYTGTAQLAKAK